MAVLVESGERLRAPITLVRTVLEASAVGAFILDPEVDPKADCESQINELIAFAEQCHLPLSHRYRPA